MTFFQEHLVEELSFNLINYEGELTGETRVEGIITRSRGLGQEGQ